LVRDPRKFFLKDPSNAFLVEADGDVTASRYAAVIRYDAQLLRRGVAPTM
jgi:hypothetical protein